MNDTIARYRRRKTRVNMTGKSRVWSGMTNDDFWMLVTGGEREQNLEARIDRFGCIDDP
jgi:hypothetical protein